MVSTDMCFNKLFNSNTLRLYFRSMDHIIFVIHVTPYR